MQRRSDRGAILLWVATMLVLLLSMTAFVIDVGALYRERRELQNGADAGALAVAQDCAEGDCLDEFGTAGTYADANASDSASAVDDVCGDGPGLVACAAPPDLPAGATGWVRVSTSTDDGSGGSEVSFYFAPVFDMLGSTVEAEAIAAWGPPSGINTIPLTFSACEFQAAGGSLDPTQVPSGDHYIYFHGSDEAEEVGETCDIGPAGQDAPGGFGWLTSGGECDAVVTDGTASGDTGNDFNKECKDILRAIVDNEEIVVIPIFGTVDDQGSNTTYTIVGFAGFQLKGYKLSSGGGSGTGATYPSGFSCPEGPGSSATCILGEFSEVSVDGNGDFGGSNDFGAVIVKMIG